jgi:small-conductance mechanosensitive channel
LPDLSNLPDLFTGLSPELRDRLLATALLLGVLITVRLAALRVLRARVTDLNTRYRWRKGINYVLIAVGVLTIGRTWSSGVAQLGTFLGLLGAGLAIALREPLTNVAGWLFLLWRRPFRVGDRVQIREIAGDVVDMRMFQFTVLEIRGALGADQPTGRLAHIPNAIVFNTPQFNATDAFPYVFSELPITLTFESDWRKAKEAFAEIGRRHGVASSELHHALHSRYALGAVDAAPVVYTSVANDGVVLTVRVLCAVRGVRASEERIWEDILQAVASWDDVDFAYPTTRFYDNRREGKPGARAPLETPAAPDRPASEP